MPKILQYAKAAVATLTAALVALATFLPVGSSAGHYVSIALAVLGAAGVYFVPNATVAKPGAEETALSMGSDR